MELKTKFRILSWAMILLVLFNITVLTTVLIKNKNRPEPPPPCENMNQFNNQPDFKGNPPHGGHFKEIMINELQPSENQLKLIDEYREEFLHNTHLYFDSIRIYSEIIDEELAKEDPNTDLIALNSENIGEFHEGLKMNFVDYYLNIKKELSPEQQKKFHKLLMNFKQQKHNNNVHNNPKNKNRHNQKNKPRF